MGSTVDVQSFEVRVEEAATVEREPVLLEVPAHASFLSVLRATASLLAARLDFTLEELDELRIAVDEAATILVQAPDGDGPVRCCFEVEGGTVRCELSRTVHQSMSEPSSFGWLLLKSVADDVDVTLAPDRTVIHLTARRDTDQADAGTPRDGRIT